MLHVDIPTTPEINALIASRGEAQVSFYLPTTPQTQHIGQARTTLGNLLKAAEDQLAAAGKPKRSIAAISEQVADLLDDDDFWSHQANSLAVFVTAESLRTFRLPNALTEMVELSDRFHVKPLLRAVSVGQHAFVLALAESVSIQSVSLALQTMQGRRPTWGTLPPKLGRELLTGGLLGAACGALVAVVALVWIGQPLVAMTVLGGIAGGVTCAALLPNLLRMMPRSAGGGGTDRPRRHRHGHPAALLQPRTRAARLTLRVQLKPTISQPLRYSFLTNSSARVEFVVERFFASHLIGVPVR